MMMMMTVIKKGVLIPVKVTGWSDIPPKKRWYPDYVPD